MERRLNPDALGRKGEKEFEQRCNDASLYCNRLEIDRTGVDFIVEFPFVDSDESLVPFDREPQPPECRAQIKSVWESQSRIRLRLSSAARLAKLRQLACIFVFVVNNDLSFSKLYCIHVIDDVLTDILKKVRECIAQNSLKLNHEIITIDFIKRGIEIALTGDAIRDTIAGFLANGHSDYLDHKVDQIENSGCTPARYSGTFTLHAKDVREASDVFLGLRQGKISDMVVRETRWNIPLPVQDLNGPGEISITPNPRKGEIVFRGQNPINKVIIDVDVVGPYMSPEPERYFRLHLNNQYLTLDIDRLKSGSINLKFETRTAKALAVADHLDCARIQRLLLEKGDIEIRLKEGPLRLDGLKTRSLDFDPSTIDANIALLEIIQRLSGHAGAKHLAISPRTVNANLATIYLLNDLVESNQEISMTPFVLLANESAFLKGELREEALVIGRLSFDEQAFVYCAAGSMHMLPKDDGVHVTVSSLYIRDIEVSSLDDNEVDRFVQGWQRETGVRAVLRVGEARKPILRED